jgi:hypothetical protein
MTNRPHLEQARENAQVTYDRRRARSAAETLAQIPPNRWDDKTRQIVGTLATISAPSRIDDLLATFDAPITADRRCRRRDHLPMGYHLPTACEADDERERDMQALDDDAAAAADAAELEERDR